MTDFGFGCMRLPLTDTSNPESFDYPLIEKLFDTFLEHGFRYFDTAYVYHRTHGEEAVRKALVERHERSEFELASKLPLRTFRHVSELEEIFDSQLERCGIEYFDYYLLHNMGVNVWPKAKDLGAVDLVLRKKTEGKIKKLGISFHDSPELFDKILSELADKIDFVQLQVNYADMEADGIRARECLDVAAKYNLPVTVMEPVKGGTLANIPEDAEKLLQSAQPDTSPAAWALRFAAQQKGVVRVLSGMNSMAQLEDNMKVFENMMPLTEKDNSLLTKAAEIINSQTAIPCTGCEYCLQGCPKGILIPKIFTIYNSAARLTGGFSSEETYYTNLVLSSAYASDCIKCGKCEQACPQHLKIRDLLENCVEKLEKNNPILAPFLTQKNTDDK